MGNKDRRVGGNSRILKVVERIPFPGTFKIVEVGLVAGKFAEVAGGGSDGGETGIGKGF